MARGIPIPYDQLPKTTTNLGGFQKSAGIEGLNTDNSASIRAAGAVAQVDPRGFIVAEQQVGAIGQAIAGEGAAITNLLIERNKSINHLKELDAAEAMELEEQAIAADIAVEPDTTKWIGIAEGRMKSLNESLLKQDLSPDARMAISTRLERWSKRQATATQISSASKVFELESEKMEGALIRAFDKGDMATALSIGQNMRDTGRWSESKLATIEGKMKERAEYNIKKAKADAFDAAEDTAIKAATEGGEEATIKALDSGAFGTHSPSNLERLRSSIKQTANGRASEVIDDVANGIAGNVYSTDEHIDAYESVHFTPALRKKAKDMLKNRDAQSEALDREVNGVRNAVEMRQKVKDYNPSQDPDRTKYFELVKDIGTRVTQSSAGEITGELYRKYGALPPKGSVRPEIQQNVSKSLDVLFDSETGAVPWRTKTPKLDSNGKPTSEMIFKDDPVEKQNALNAQTVIEMKMNDWFRDNPNDANSLAKVQEQLGKLIPEGTRMGAFQNMMNEYKPVSASPPNLGAPGGVGPSGPSGAEFMNPMGASNPAYAPVGDTDGTSGTDFVREPTISRVTSYAYQNDETPDSNSSAGIGAFVPDKEQAKIKRGEYSPYRLREGDVAVSRDVEARMRKSGIRPGDEVEVQMEDGSSLITRWMDRTAAEFEGKTVTGRWDFYRAGKSSKHPNEAGKVIGFRRAPQPELFNQ